jgi:hypothetical protein
MHADRCASLTRLSARMSRDHLRHRNGEAFRVIDEPKLVRDVRIRVWTEKPVTRYCVPGDLSPSIAIKGIVPPAPIDMPSQLKALCEGGPSNGTALLNEGVKPVAH